MKIRTATICMLLLLTAPVACLAQYSEKWSDDVTLTLGTSLVPGSLGNTDADAALELVVSNNAGSNLHRVEIRNAITGAVEFTSASTTQSGAQWTIYVLNLDTDAADEVLATDGTNTIIIDYAGALGVSPGGLEGSLQELRPAQPNPFASCTSLAYSLPTAGKAEIEVFDVAGRMVRRLGGERVTPGEHKIDWDGRDNSGNALQPGMYLYRLNVDSHATEARKTIRLGS